MGSFPQRETPFDYPFPWKLAPLKNLALLGTLGKPPKKFFVKSWEFGPRKGGGPEPIPTFFKIDQNLICLGNWPEKGS